MLCHTGLRGAFPCRIREDNREKVSEFTRSEYDTMPRSSLTFEHSGHAETTTTDRQRSVGLRKARNWAPVEIPQREAAQCNTASLPTDILIQNRSQAKSQQSKQHPTWRTWGSYLWPDRLAVELLSSLTAPDP